MDCYLHGESIVFKSKVPEGATRMNVKGHLVIAPSETSGNNHVIDAVAGVEFYEKGGVLYVRNETPATVRCVIESRHDTIELPVGEWEVGIQQEYDPFTARKRNVAD